MKTERGVSNMWSVCSRRAESNNLTQMTDSAVSPHLSVENQRTHACHRSTHASKLFLQGNTTIPASKDF